MKPDMYPFQHCSAFDKQRPLGLKLNIKSKKGPKHINSSIFWPVAKQRPLGLELNIKSEKGQKMSIPGLFGQSQTKATWP